MENPKKKPSEQGQNQEQAQPTCQPVEPNPGHRVPVTEVTAMPTLLPTNVKKGGCRKKVKQRDCLNPENDMKIKKGDSTNLLHKSQIGVGGLKGNGFLCRFGLN